MATIRDVALAAGVSTMTVSRVLNKSGYVSADARARVEAAVAELGYVRNTLGLSLRFKRTKTLALVLTDITNPFFTTIARGVEDVASDHGFTVVLCNTDESESEESRYLTSLLQRQVDGVLLVPARSTPGSVQWLQDRGMPVVVLDRSIPNMRADVVRCDSEGGAHELTRLLIELGHRRIALLGGPAHVSTAQDRAAGFMRAHREANVAVDAALLLHGQYTLAGGASMMRQLLALPNRPTALFASNNFIAIGAFRALRDAGLRVPDDIALVAFDDLPEGLVLDPFLTVAAQPADRMGRVATELLLARIAGDATEPHEIVLPIEIIIRRSSGTALKAASPVNVTA